MITTKIPGKLFIAGEYAVTEPGNRAILVAVDKFITISLEKKENQGTIIVDNRAINWTRKNGKIHIDESPRLKYVLKAMELVESYAKELGKEPIYYKLQVDSQLETREGIKYGLGSSSAVTVAAVDGLCKLYKIDLSKKELFKLAALVNLSINRESSCGDIAACVYGGWIEYRSFNRQLVIEKIKSMPIGKLLTKDWPYLEIRELVPPKDLRLIIGWTGKPASSINLVGVFNEKKQENREVFNKFLTASEKCVDEIIGAFHKKDIEEIKRQIERNRKLLIALGEGLGLEIETPILKNLSEIANTYGACAKLSGAGGGDCGIAIFNQDLDLNNLVKDWEKAGIKYLPLTVYEK